MQDASRKPCVTSEFTTSTLAKSLIYLVLLLFTTWGTAAPVGFLDLPC
jgi:hypothetical protein